MYVSKFLTRSERAKQADETFTSCFIKNFGQSIDEEKLHEVFAVSVFNLFIIMMISEDSMINRFNYPQTSITV